MKNKSMGELISGLRKEKGMTQRELAEQMNVTDKAVSKWERDLSCPDINSLPRLAEVLGISVEELLNTSKKDEATESKTGAVADLVFRAIPVAMGGGGGCHIPAAQHRSVLRLLHAGHWTGLYGDQPFKKREVT